MRSNITENLGALVDTENAARVTFDLNPDSFDDSKSTEFAEITIPGMTELHNLPSLRSNGRRAKSDKNPSGLAVP